MDNHPTFEGFFKPHEFAPPAPPPKPVPCSDDAAMAIYLRYPRKAGQPDALKMIKRACKAMAKKGIENPAALLMARTMAFAQSPAGQKPEKAGGKDVRCHPATWFNPDKRAGYDDDPAVWLALNGDNKVKEKKKVDWDQARKDGLI